MLLERDPERRTSHGARLEKIHMLRICMYFAMEANRPSEETTFSVLWSSRVAAVLVFTIKTFFMSELGLQKFH